MQAHPDGLAVSHGHRRVTYRALYDDVVAFHGGLVERGVKSGDTVLCALPNSPEFVALYFAVARAGATILTVAPNGPRTEFERPIADFPPTVGVVTSALQHGDLLQGGNRRRPVVVTAAARAGQPVDLERLRGTPVPAAPADPARPFSILYSSGSTGRPKAIRRSQANQVAEARHIVDTARLSHEDVVLCTVPLSHALGQFCCLLVSMAAGAELLLFERTKDQDGSGFLPFRHDVPRLIRTARERSASVLPGVPRLYETMLNATDVNSSDLSSLRYCLSGSNFLSADTRAAFFTRFRTPIRQTYGSSEVGTVAWDCEDPPSADHQCVGLPLQGVEVKILDRDGPYPLDPGQTGEIAVRSASVIATASDPAEPGAPNGFVRTGDLGRTDRAGRLYIEGRTTLDIDRGGYKVAIEKIERVLTAHPAVVVAGVTNRPSPSGPQLAAYVVCEREIDTDELRAHCVAELASFEVPDVIFQRPELPMSPLGKVRRGELR